VQNSQVLYWANCHCIQWCGVCNAREFNPFQFRQHFGTDDKSMFNLQTIYHLKSSWTFEHLTVLVNKLRNKYKRKRHVRQYYVDTDTSQIIVL